MNDIKSLLTDTLNPQARLMQETRGLVKKWEKLGLLDGIKSDTEKCNMSILLENQAKQLIDEASACGTTANSEQWAGVALPLVRRVFAEFAAKEFVSVQPMNLPSGLVFYLDFKYGTDQFSHKKDAAGTYSSLFGGTFAKTGSTDKPIGGLYGAGRFAYTVNDQSLTTVDVTVSSASMESINWMLNTYTQASKSGSVDTLLDSISASYAASQLWVVTTTEFKTLADAASKTFDSLAIRSFVPARTSASVALVKNYFPAFTKLTATGEVAFLVSASNAAGGINATASNLQDWTIHYIVQPSPQTRGDFEDTTGEGAGASSIGIPEVNLELKSEPIVAKTRKLKAVWTPELAQDLNAYHSIDAEAELTALLSEYVSMEIDLEILDMLITQAPARTTERWSAKLNREIVSDGSGGWTAQDQTVAGTGGYYTKSTWYQTLGNKIQKVSNRIHQLTLRGGANFLVCSPDVATILESIPGYVVNTDGDQAKFAMGVSRVGSFASRFQVYKNPYMTDNIVLIGFRGNSFLETGAVYAPYIPLVQTPLVYDPVNFTPRRGVMTRYAKLMVRPEFYGKVLIADLDAV